MDEQKKFSAIRLNKDNISSFQDAKFVVESVRFKKMSNDEFMTELINSFLNSNPEIQDALAKMKAARNGDKQMPAHLQSSVGS